MGRHWLTIASPTREAMVNPLIAACEAGFVPDTIRVLSNPGVAHHVDAIRPLYETILEAHGTEPTIHVDEVPDETAFDAIAEHYREHLETTATTAVDITPGRKFMSAIAFQAGLSHGADHVFYLRVETDEYYGQIHPDIPRTALEFIDFTEVV